jgi:hypothetical protein
VAVRGHRGRGWPPVAGAATCTELKSACRSGKDWNTGGPYVPGVPGYCNSTWEHCMKSGFWEGGSTPPSRTPLSLDAMVAGRRGMNSRPYGPLGRLASSRARRAPPNRTHGDPSRPNRPWRTQWARGAPRGVKGKQREWSSSVDYVWRAIARSIPTCMTFSWPRATTRPLGTLGPPPTCLRSHRPEGPKDLRGREASRHDLPLIGAARCSDPPSGSRCRSTSYVGDPGVVCEQPRCRAC